MTLSTCGRGIVFLKISWNSVHRWVTLILPSQTVGTSSVKGTALLYNLDARRGYFARGHGRVREVMLRLCPLEYAAGWRCGEWYLLFLSFLCWWFRAETTWVILSQKRCWADLKQKGKSKLLFQVHLWFSWIKAQSCQLMIWSSVLQCIVLSYSSRPWVMEGLKTYCTQPSPFPHRFHDFEENRGNVTSVYPQGWDSGRQRIKNWLRLWSEKVVIYSSYKKILKKKRKKGFQYC